MKQKNISHEFIKKRKFLMVLPLLTLPFLVFSFWLLSDGNGTASAMAEPTNHLLSTLPEVDLSAQKGFDKMSYYEQASSAATKQSQLEQSDPYFQTEQTPLGSGTKIAPFDIQNSTRSSPENQEAELYKKLQQLNNTLQKPPANKHVTASSQSKSQNTTSENQEIQRLKMMMENLENGKGNDPEMTQLDGMLQKILAIQHPQAFENRLAENDPKSLYSAIPAMIDGKQKVTEGGVVRMKLLQDVTLNQQLIHKGQRVYGTCQFSNQRMQLKISNILIGNAILPVDLTVFDSHDGMVGINVPEAEINVAWRNGSDQAIQGIQVLPFDQSPEMQIAGAGIAAAKGLFSKKIKKIKVKLADGYPLLIRDNQKIINHQ